MPLKVLFFMFMFSLSYLVETYILIGIARTLIFSTKAAAYINFFSQSYKLARIYYH